MLRSRAPKITLLLVLLLSACAAPQRPAPSEPGDAIRARQLQGVGNYAEAAQLWQQAAIVAVGAERQEFRLRAAEAWLLAGEAAKSRQQLQQVQDAQLESPGQSRMALLQAELALLDADAQSAEFYLAAARGGLAAPEMERYRLATQRLVRLQTDPASFAMTSVASALAGMGPYTTYSGVALLQLMEDIPSRQLQEIAQDEARSASLRHWPELALTVRNLLVTGQDKASVARQWSLAQAGHEVDEQGYIDLVDSYSALFTLPGNIAVLLPFEGGLAAAGKAIRDGIVSAFMEAPGNSELKFYPTSDEPDSAVSAYFAAIGDGADWIIGPLRRESVAAMAGLGGLGVPALMLNNADESLAAQREMGLVYQMSLSQELEAQAVAESALARNWNNALVLTADSAWGQRMKETFERAFIDAGGTVVSAAEFSSAESDHSSLLKTVLKIQDSQNRKDRLQATLGLSLNFEPTRRDDFDFIFLAASPDQGRQIRPQLRFHDAGSKPVLAMGRIFSGQLDTGADQDLNGIMFPATRLLLEPGGLDELPFSSLRSGSMGPLFALGADAWNVMRWLPLLQKDEDLQYPGLAGSFRLDKRGRLVRTPAWAVFSQGRPTPLADEFWQD